mgnify:CR=1 FL=1
MPALYLTIWAALALFAAGEIGRSGRGRPPAWAWWSFVLGLALAIVHTLIAFDVVHNWVHDDAVRNTAMQTEAVFGARVGWGVYVNYLFFAVWLADAWWWRAAGPDHVRSTAVTWGLRIFYLVIILNAVVIFAAPPRRPAGLAVIALLAWAWARPRLARGLPLGPITRRRPPS